MVKKQKERQASKWKHMNWKLIKKRYKNIAWIRSHHLHLQWKFKLWAEKFTWGNKAKHDVNKLIVFKNLFTKKRNILPLHLRKTFLPIIWIFTEVEGDRIESRLPFKIFSTLIDRLEHLEASSKGQTISKSRLASQKTNARIWFVRCEE